MTNLRYGALASGLFVTLAISSCGSGTTKSVTVTSIGPAPGAGSTSTTSVNSATTKPVAPATTAPLATASTTVTSATSTAAPSSDGSEKTRQLFASVTADTPGCSVAVSRNGKVIFNESFGASSLNPTKPLTPDMSFDIGSTTKQFTATAVQMLVDRGQLDWDTPISTFLPELPSWATTVTISHLAHHTSGIPDYIELLYSAGITFNDTATEADVVRSLTKVDKLKFAPASSFEYSNSNYEILGLIVERSTKAPLGEFIEKNLLSPAGMTAVWDYKKPIAGKVLSYTRDADGQPWKQVEWNWPQMGASGVVSNAGALAAWGTQYFAPTVGGADVNAKRVARAVPSNLGSGPTARYGLGIIEEQVEGVGRVLYHPGSREGYVTAFAVAPDRKLAVASVCLSESGPTATQFFDLELLKAWM
jgi:CubicO group peptidase (beta-lactamase class C family)